MTNVVKSYSLFLNTREADYGDSNNCTFVFTTPFVLTNVNNRFRVSTPMIELPYSFSQLNLNNNKLQQVMVHTPRLYSLMRETIISLSYYLHLYHCL